MKKRNIFVTLGYIAVYFVIYLTGRLIWCDMGENSLMEWLFAVRPSGEHSYLYGWLLSSKIFWYALAVSVIPSLWGKFRFSLITTVGFAVGIVAGIVFGPYPEGAALGHGHYGWAIWSVIYLISAAAGIIAEKRKK